MVVESAEIVGMGIVVGGMVLMLDLVDPARWKIVRLVGWAVLVGGFALMVGNGDGPWLRTMVAMSLIVVGSSAIGAARRWRPRADRSNADWRPT